MEDGANILATTTDAVAQIENGGATEEQVLAALNFIAALKETTRTLASRVEAAAMVWIEANHDIESGPVRYYVAPNKTTKCRSARDALRVILEATNGDVDVIAGLLASDAWKPGTCKKLLDPSTFETLFETRVTSKLETGEPVKRLQRADERFG